MAIAADSAREIDATRRARSNCRAELGAVAWAETGASRAMRPAKAARRLPRATQRLCTKKLGLFEIEDGARGPYTRRDSFEYLLRCRKKTLYWRKLPPCWPRPRRATTPSGSSGR